MTDCPHGGWYLLALTSELAGEVTALDLGGRALMAVRDEGRIRVFDARCPHRGAHLGYGGVRMAVRGAPAVRCPFHGKSIGLGAGTARLCVIEHTAVTAGEALFVRLGTDPAGDLGFEQAIKEIAAEKEIVGGFVQPVRVPPEYVIENAFDVSHFAVVHKVPKVTGFHLRADGDDGSGGAGWLGIEGDFVTNPPPWEAGAGQTFRSHFYARAFSPSVVVTELGPPGTSHTVITSANHAPGGCVARVAIGVRPAARSALTALQSGARRAFDQDIAVWEHLDPAAPVHLDAGDVPAMAFRQFCAGFGRLG